jgi:hypothetical protein
MTPDMPSALDRAEAELADTLEDPARISSLSYEESAAVVGELRALRAEVGELRGRLGLALLGPEDELQFVLDDNERMLQQHTDDVADLERLRARDEAAAVVARVWVAAKDVACDNALWAALDALVHAHGRPD